MLGSLAAIGSAFVGTKVYPIQTGGDPLVGPAVLGATITGAIAAAERALTPAPEPLATETEKPEEEIEQPVVEQSPLEETTTQASPTDISSSSEPPPEATGDVSGELNETTQSVPSEGGKRKLPFWFKHSGTKH